MIVLRELTDVFAKWQFIMGRCTVVWVDYCKIRHNVDGRKCARDAIPIRCCVKFLEYFEAGGEFGSVELL